QVTPGGPDAQTKVNGLGAFLIPTSANATAVDATYPNPLLTTSPHNVTYTVTNEAGLNHALHIHGGSPLLADVTVANDTDVPYVDNNFVTDVGNGHATFSADFAQINAPSGTNSGY